jgi:prevent-host-death family protein
MHISVTDAKAQFTELVRRAERGEEIILTRHGHSVVRLMPVKQAVDREARRALLGEIQASANPNPGPSAARSQDFLYGDDGLPK